VKKPNNFNTDICVSFHVEIFVVWVLLIGT